MRSSACYDDYTYTTLTYTYIHTPSIYTIDLVSSPRIPSVCYVVEGEREVKKIHDLIGRLERLALPPCLFRGALLQQPARCWPFSYSTEHQHNQPPRAAKLSSTEAVLTSSATATVTRKQSLSTCGCVCVCVGVCLCVYAHAHISVCVTVYTHLYYHVESRASCVYQKNRGKSSVHGYGEYALFYLTVISPCGSIVSHLSFWSRVYTNLGGFWVFDGSSPTVDGINTVSIFFFCQLIFVQKSARSYLARLICQSRCLDKLPVHGELTWVPLTYPLICVCWLMNDRQCIFHYGA